jgi:pilus assembly protein Flp/PilA
MQSPEKQNERIEIPAIARKQLGLTTVEYAVAGGLIVAGVVVLFKALGGQVGTVITALTNALK